MKKLNNSNVIKKYIYQLNLDLKRGLLQFATLHLISQMPSYAHEIKDEISNMTRGNFDIDKNNLYKKLRLLEKDGILKSKLKHSSYGADRKYYSITPFGRKLYNEMYQLLIPVMSSLQKRTK